MLLELSIIKLLLKYSLYQEFFRYVSIPKEKRELKMLFHTLQALQEKHPNVDKTIDELEATLYTSYPMLRDVEKAAVADLFSKLRTIEVNDDVAHDLVKKIQIRTEAANLALEAFNVSEGRSTMDQLSSIFERLGNPAKAYAQDCFVTDDLFKLEQHSIMDGGFNWRLNCLNISLGPVRAGDFGFVFARPETGKTTFLADQVTYFAGQTDKPVIWFNNEEQGEKVRLRTYQAALGLTLHQLWKDKQKNLDAYRTTTKGNLLIYDDGSIHRQDVERIIQANKPSMVIFDQIDKIKGFSADRPDIVFGRIYQWARELAKKGCAIIGTCQSDGTGEGIRWLTMGHVAEAKTAKQAEADWILGIGKSNEGGTEDVRYLNISKNKLLGSNDTDPNMRHGRFEVFIKPTIARYEDL